MRMDSHSYLIAVKLRAFVRYRRSARHGTICGGKAETHEDMGPSLRTIAELNIRHYRALLETEIDPAKRP
jgi:hypothetical protein